MEFIQNLSIRNKLLLISLVPLAASMYFLVTALSAALEKRKNLARVYDDVVEIEKISDVLYSVQEERGYSINYLNSRGRLDRTEMFNSRSQTDKSIAALHSMLNEQKKTRSFDNLDSLAGLRKGVNSIAFADACMAVPVTN